MDRSHRLSGIPLLRRIPWGTHICHFYHSADELLELLVPFFKAGLEHNEFCVWITSGPLTCAGAESALRAAVRDFDARLACGQLIILPAEKSYLAGGEFNTRRMFDDWISKVTDPQAHGFTGARASGDTSWLGPSAWDEFQRYEALLDAAVAATRTLVICTYPIKQCGPGEMIQVVKNHGIALIRRNGAWEMIENMERLRAREATRASPPDCEPLAAGEQIPFSYQEVICNARGTPVDFRILLVNEAAERMTGWQRREVVGRRGTELMPWITTESMRRLGEIGLSGEPARFEHFFLEAGSPAVYAYSPRRGYFAVVAQESAANSARGAGPASEPVTAPAVEALGRAVPS